MGALWRWRSPLSAAMYALAPVAILVSAYHGNTDAACALGILLAALALERGSWLAAGLALALAFAVNVKLIPLLFLPARADGAAGPARAHALAAGIRSGGDSVYSARSHSD